MKKPKPARESESKLTPFIAPTISAIGGVLVALIALVPYFRSGDMKKNEELTKQLQTVQQSVEDMKVSIREGQNGTAKSRNADILAPQIQLRWAPIDAKLGPDDYSAKGRLALEKSGFTGRDQNDKVIFGFDKEYTGLVWSVSSNLVLFVVSGPDWQTADSKVENLRRGF